MSPPSYISVVPRCFGASPSSVHLGGMHELVARLSHIVRSCQRCCNHSCPARCCSSCCQSSLSPLSNTFLVLGARCRRACAVFSRAMSSPISNQRSSLPSLMRKRPPLLRIFLRMNWDMSGLSFFRALRYERQLPLMRTRKRRSAGVHVRPPPPPTAAQDVLATTSSIIRQSCPMPE